MWPSLSSFTETRRQSFSDYHPRGGFWLIGMADFAIDLKKKSQLRLLLTSQEVAPPEPVAKPAFRRGADGLRSKAAVSGYPFVRLINWKNNYTYFHVMKRKFWFSLFGSFVNAHICWPRIYGSAINGNNASRYSVSAERSQSD